MTKENIVREIELEAINLNKVKRSLELVEAFGYNGNYYGLIQPPLSKDWPADERGNDMPIVVTRDYLVQCLKGQISGWEGRIKKLTDELSKYEIV